MAAITYSVLVGNLGWCGQDIESEEQARIYYDEYVAISKGKLGIGHRGYDEQVSLWASDDHDPIAEYEPYKPDVVVELNGPNGNAFVIIARVVEALEGDGRDNLTKEYKQRATGGSYENLVKNIGDYCNPIDGNNYDSTEDEDDAWESDNNWYEGE